jgi:hypothetical protein
MDKVVNKTVNALTRFGERLERHISTDGNDNAYYERSGSGYMFPSAGSAFQRPVDKKYKKNNSYSSKQRDLIYGGARKYSSDNLAAAPGDNSFSNYRQNPMPNPYANGVDRPPYGTGIGAPFNYNQNSNYGQNSQYSYGSNYGAQSGGYPGPSPGSPYGGPPGSVGYAPDYYIAERRQMELVPAPPPRYIRQQVPYPVPVDRPVPQPYPVQVPQYFPVDRPVPVPYPSPVPVDRPVPVPVPVPVPSPPPPPICVPYPVPTPVPCYIPVGIPVPSPPPSPVMFEQSVTHSQRWYTGSPAMMNQPRYLAGSPAMGMNPFISYGNGSFNR